MPNPRPTRRRFTANPIVRACVLVGWCALALQLAFVVRIAAMRVVDPASTTFQRSEIARLLVERGQVAWAAEWVDRSGISPNLQRAVIASEDDAFVEHGGADWDAIEQAWDRNQRATERAARRANAKTPAREPKLRGGSTITQQLAKNLLLSGERTLPRKGQELVLTYALEALLGKARILELYLNHVEWGEGVFGAQAAAQHYFSVDAARLTPAQAARLAVMLPAPKRFETQPRSAYVLGRSAVIQARMGGVVLP